MNTKKEFRITFYLFSQEKGIKSIKCVLLPKQLSKPWNKKNYLTNSFNSLIIVVKLFIYLRNFCSGLMTKNLGYLDFIDFFHSLFTIHEYM